MGIRASIAGLVTGLLAAAVVPSGGASAEADEGYRGDRIAVIARVGPPEDGVGALELREPDGAWRRLADDATGGVWTMFEWSNDGERIYFWGFEGDGGQALPRVVDVATSAVRELGPDVSDTISPDERWTAWRDSHDRLWIRALDGPDETRLLSDGAIRRPVKWDPESSRLAAGFGTLHVVDLAGNRTRLSPDGMWVGNFAWSPDGHRLAVLARPDPAPPGTMSHYELWVAEADGSSLRQVTHLADRGLSAGGPANGENQWSYSPAWSPDAQEVAIHVAALDAEDASTEGVYRIDVATGEARFVARPGPRRERSNEVDWSVDGTHLAFDIGGFDSEGQPSSLAYVVDVADGTSEQLTPADESYVESLAFSPGLVTRLAGRTRVQTAITVSRHAFAAAETVVLARADLYPDALTGAPLAAKHGGPLLLTGADGLHPDVASELVRLGTATVYLLGSEAALSRQVAHDLAAMEIGVVRLGGIDRFATARLVAAEVGGTEVYVVEGKDADPNRGWPDAVAVAGLAAFEQRPILLVETDVLPPETARALDDLGASHATIVGGAPAVSEDVRRAIERRDVATDRLAGSDRFATSAAVAGASVAAGMDPAGTWFATGRNWPDALGAGPAAAATGGVLLLVDGGDLGGSPDARTWLDRYAGSFERVRFAGGPDVLSPTVAVETERRGQP